MNSIKSLDKVACLIWVPSKLGGGGGVALKCIIAMVTGSMIVDIVVLVFILLGINNTRPCPSSSSCPPSRHLTRPPTARSPSRSDTEEGQKMGPVGKWRKKAQRDSIHALLCRKNGRSIRRSQPFRPQPKANAAYLRASGRSVRSMKMLKPVVISIISTLS